MSLLSTSEDISSILFRIESLLNGNAFKTFTESCCNIVFMKISKEGLITFSATVCALPVFAISCDAVNPVHLSVSFFQIS